MTNSGLILDSCSKKSEISLDNLINGKKILYLENKTGLRISNNQEIITNFKLMNLYGNISPFLNNKIEEHPTF